MSPHLQNQPLLSPSLRSYVEVEVSDSRWGSLKSIRRTLERQSKGSLTTWQGNILDLALDQTTKLLTVVVAIDGDVEPEVVDYEEFKKFVLRERL